MEGVNTMLYQSKLIDSALDLDEKSFGSKFENAVRVFYNNYRGPRKKRYPLSKSISVEIEDYEEEGEEGDGDATFYINNRRICSFNITAPVSLIYKNLKNR